MKKKHLYLVEIYGKLKIEGYSLKNVREKIKQDIKAIAYNGIGDVKVIDHCRLDLAESTIIKICKGGRGLG